MPQYIMLVNFTDQGLMFRTGKTNRARRQSNLEFNAKPFG
jgi:hypothetical protein